jgi:magnesium transporter
MRPVLSELEHLQPEQLDALRHSRNFKALRHLFRDNDVADISEALAAANVDECVVYLRLVPRDKRAELFAFLPFSRQEELLEELPDNVVEMLVNEMEPDDRTRLLEELPFEIRGRVMLKLSPEERKMAWQLLSYPEDSVGRLMTPEFLRLSVNDSVTEGLAKLRWDPNYPEEQLLYLFVTDADGKYLGEVSLASLVLTDPPSKKIGEIMNTTSIILRAEDHQEAAVDHFRKYDRPILPVVDDENVLVGMITSDDVFDVAEEEATEDMQAFGGQSTLEDSYFDASLFQLFRKRAGWLAMLFVGGILTAGVLRHYEGMTASMVWLVFFVPLIISSGGNTGSQAAALVIRGLAVREMENRDWHRVLRRELVVGLALGLGLGIMGFVTARFWNLSSVVGLVVFMALVGVVIFGVVTGAMLPFLFKRLNLDPAVSSSPLLASLVDIFGVLIFYNTARWVIAAWENTP